MRIGVTGGRDFGDGLLLDAAMRNHVSREDRLIHGDARGADRMAALWCEVNGVAVESHPALWDRHGKAAGFIRNQAMVASGLDKLLAFPGGRGTADMVNRARKAGVEVIEIGASQ